MQVKLWANGYYWKWCKFLVKGIDFEGNETVLINESDCSANISLPNNYDISKYEKIYMSVCPGAPQTMGGTCWIKINVNNY